MPAFPDLQELFGDLLNLLLGGENQTYVIPEQENAVQRSHRGWAGTVRDVTNSTPPNPVMSHGLFFKKEWIFCVFSLGRGWAGLSFSWHAEHYENKDVRLNSKTLLCNPLAFIEALLRNCIQGSRREDILLSKIKGSKFPPLTGKAALTWMAQFSLICQTLEAKQVSSGWYLDWRLPRGRQ